MSRLRGKRGPDPQCPPEVRPKHGGTPILHVRLPHDTWLWVQAQGGAPWLRQTLLDLQQAQSAALLPPAPAVLAPERARGSEPAVAAPAMDPVPSPTRRARRRGAQPAVDPYQGWYRGLGVRRPGLRTLHYIRDEHLLCGLHQDVLERKALPPAPQPFLYFKPHPHRQYGDPFPCKACQAVLDAERGATGD